MNETPTTPAHTPRRANRPWAATCPTEKCGRSRKAWSPSTARATTLAVTEETTTMPKERAAKSRRMISIAKTTAARGALKRRRDAAGGTAGAQQPQPVLGDTHRPAQRRAEGRADLDDRSLPAHRAAAPDAQRRGQRLDDGDAGRDASA